MITYEYCGRLGNICWQIATIFDYCKMYGYDETQIVFPNDTTNTHWTYDFSYYMPFFKNIRSHFISSEELKSMTKENILSDYNGEDKGNNITFRGYSPKLGAVLNKPYTQELFRRLFLNIDLRNELVNRYSDIYSNFKTYALHIRRTDYLKFFPKYRFLDSENIINTIDKLNLNEKSKIIVFSDDIPWCREVLKDYGDRIFYMTQNKDYEDLLLMSACQNIIRAGSSFSDIAERIH